MSQCMLCYKDRCAVKLFEIPSIPIADHIGHSQLRNILLFIHVHDVVMGGVPPLEQSRAVTLYTLYSDSVMCILCSSLCYPRCVIYYVV